MLTARCLILGTMWSGVIGYRCQEVYLKLVFVFHIVQVSEVYTSSGKFFFVLGNCYWQRILHFGLELGFGLLSCKPPWFSSWHCYKP